MKRKYNCDLCGELKPEDQLRTAGAWGEICKDEAECDKVRAIFSDYPSFENEELTFNKLLYG